MKFRIILLVILTTLLSACNFTLAEDVTPPPGYVPPTPMPTLGNLFPEKSPSVTNGAAIYVEKCLACHGETGMGDGPQGIQLGVTVTAYGLPEIARAASPAQWYEVVTRGRMDRFMPPFSSLNDQERWDVVAYITTLHTTPEQIAQGRELFEANCANCSTDFFQNQEKMSPLTEVELARLVKQGNDAVPAFGSNFTEAELWATAAYLRTLSFDTALASTPTPEPVAATATTVPADAGTPSAEGTPIEGTPQVEVTKEATAVPQPGFGTVSGSIENNTGADLPSELTITLRGYDHGADPSAGPQEVLTLDGTVNADGSYSFSAVEIPTSRIFLAETVFGGMTMQSEFVIVEDGATSVTVPAIILYETTTDTSVLVVDEVRMFVEYGDTDVTIYNAYSFRNTGDKTIVVELKDGAGIPFIKTPEGMQSGGYEGLQDSEPFVNTETGFAIPPSENSYGLIAISTTAKNDKINVSQSFVLPASVFTVFLPEGIQAESATLTDEGLQSMQNLKFHIYTSANLSAGENVTFTISGTPNDETAAVATPETTNPNQNLLIGAGALGVALILAGAWMYLRDRKRASEDENEEVENEFDSSEEVMDAIIALDEQHLAKKISDEGYQKRRAELKDILKGMM